MGDTRSLDCSSFITSHRFPEIGAESGPPKGVGKVTPTFLFRECKVFHSFV